MKIQFSILILFLTLFAHNSYTQTIEETVNYLDAKGKEVVGHEYIFNVDSKEWKDKENSPKKNVYHIKDMSIVYTEGLLKINYVQSEEDFYTSDSYERRKVEVQYTFNPAHITKVEIEDSNYRGGIYDKNASGGSIKVTLAAETGAVSSRNKCERFVWEGNDQNCSGNYSWSDRRDTSVQAISIPYLQADPTYFNKIKKALFHLKNLVKSDDPFAD